MYEVLKYIQDHIDLPLRAADVARTFGYSKWYFCSLFKQFAGTSFTEYVRHYRMQQCATELLRNRKATEVAQMFGYDTQSGFNKAFIAEFGCTPREFKKKTHQYHIDYQRRRSEMFQLSDRISILRDEVVNQKKGNDEICLQREMYFTLGIASVPENGTNCDFITAGICRFLECCRPVIRPGELIVGYNFGDGYMGEHWTCCYHDPETAGKLLRKNGFTEATIEEYFRVLEPAYLRPRIPNLHPADGVTDIDMALRKERAAHGSCQLFNHTILMYSDVLELGFTGLLEKVEHYERIHGPSNQYDNLKILCRTACEFGKRYAAEALRIAEDPTLTEERRAELLQIAEVCAQVPAHPARTLHEAVQSLWFAHIINTVEDGINANSLGRLDQIFYPYYKKDLEEGRITKEDAFELICCLWLKLYRDYDVQQSCVGGCDENGNSVINDLSYMMLDATEQLDFIRCMSVRYSADTDKTFLRRALEVVGHVQKGVPFFFNDDVMIPALCSKGIPLEAARTYTQIGCVETVIPGRANPHAVTGMTNLLKAVEYALNEGRSMLDPDAITVLETPPIDTFTTYDDLKHWVFKHLENFIDSVCRQVALATKACETIEISPVKTLLTRGCVERSLDFHNHGAEYDYYHVMLAGIPNTADSLAAIKKLVYDEKRYTLQEIVHQMKNDFPDEAIRLDLLNHAPKFGNDIDEVDQIAAELMDYCCSLLDQMDKKYGLSFHAQPFTFLWMLDDGRLTAASADGRKAGEPTAYSVSPMQGRDFNGFTALMNSISKLPTTRTPGSASAIVEADPLLFTDANLDLFVDILRVSAKKGLCNVQFNVTDADTLMEAQKHPDKYKNLAVRVSGFSQKFVLLSKELQDHIIGRTKHKCL